MSTCGHDREVSRVEGPIVAGHKRDGRSVYDEGAKQELIVACLKPGVSVARMAMEHGINTNLLRAWIAAYQRRSVQETSAIVAETQDVAFVAVHVEASQNKVQSVSQCERALGIPEAQCTCDAGDGDS